MLHSRTAIEDRYDVAVVVPPVAGVGSVARDAGDREVRLAAERAVDEVLADSFPASDPPPWTPGIVRPRPGNGAAHGAPFADGRSRLHSADVLDVSRTHRERTFPQVIVSSFAAAGIALIAGVAIVLAGLPLALALRGLLEAVGWFLGISLR